MDMMAWRTWEDATFEEAARANKPLFLWIDYRGCRACARMEAESFSDSTIAEQLHRHYIPIRIDRDEYPDVDHHFQRLFVAMTGKERGWPLTLFLSPDNIPLYVTAYVPPQTQDGMMGMDALPELVARQYAADPIQLASKGHTALQELAPHTSVTATRIDPDALAATLRTHILEVYDAAHGGYGGEPKQLHVALLKAALALHHYDHEVEPLHALSHTLDRMAETPIWDDEQGGYFCCTDDAAWMAPQRRKNMAENAIMAIVLLRMGHATGEERYREQAYRICDWALEQMMDPEHRMVYAGVIDGGIDRRIFTAPNALMATALLLAARHREQYRPDALGLLANTMEQMRSGPDLLHRIGDERGVTYLVDYAALSAALLAAWDVTGNRHFIATAGEIGSAAIRRFYDNGRWGVGDGVWHDPTLFVDAALPSPAATMVMVLHRLDALLDHAYAPFVEQTLAVASYALMRRPITKAGMAEAALRVYGSVEDPR